MRSPTTAKRIKLFSRIQRASNWFDSRVTALGQLVLLGFIVALIFALDPRQTFAYQLAAVLLAVLSIALVSSIIQRPKLRLRRLLPQFLTVGETGDYLIELENTRDRACNDISLKEVLVGSEPFAALPLNMVENSASWFERKVGFLPWLAAQRLRAGARAESSTLQNLPRGATLKLKQSIKPLRRGLILFEGVEVRQTEVLGILRSVSRHSLKDKVIVLPPRVVLPRVKWRSHRQFHRGGVSLAASVGESQEFIGLRDYRPGDSLRQIHWRSFAKLGKPVIREYQDEYFDHHALFLDTTISSGQEALFEAAVTAAASFVDSPRPSDALLDLVLVEDKAWRLTAGRAANDKNRLLEHLAIVEPKFSPPPAAESEALSRALRNCGTVVLICCCWDFRIRRMIELIEQQGAVVLAIQIVETVGADTDRHQVRPQSLAAELHQVLTTYANG